MKSTSGKILASVALVGTAAAVAGMGTYGEFTTTTTASQSVHAATVQLNNGAAETVTLGEVKGMLPGDRVERFLTLKNTGTSALAAISLTTASGGSALTTDPNYPLKLSVESCSEEWTPVANGPDTCKDLSPVGGFKDGAIIQTATDLGELQAKATGVSSFLKITLFLPTEAPNTFQGKSDTITFTFKGTQPTGTVS